MTDCQVGYYGKLPASLEFLRQNPGGAVIDGLDQWAREGIVYTKSRLRQDWESASDDAGIWNFLCAPAEGKDIVVGVCMPSRDQARREFPFFIFVRIDRDNFKTQLTLIPRAFASFLSLARDVLQALAGCTDLQECRHRLQSLQVPAQIDAGCVQQAYDEALKTCTMDQFWSQIQSGQDDRIKPWVERNLRDSLMPLRGQASRRLEVRLSRRT